MPTVPYPRNSPKWPYIGGRQLVSADVSGSVWGRFTLPNDLRASTRPTYDQSVQVLESKRPPEAATAGRRLSVLDLFAGAGGLGLGFHLGSDRYETARAVEIDIAAAATYASNFGAVVYAGGIERWLVEEATPSVDVVIGGPPCQGFSAIGKRDPADVRNYLWRPYVEAVRRARPRAVEIGRASGRDRVL